METTKSFSSLKDQITQPVEQAQLLGSLLDGTSALVALKDLDHHFLFANQAVENLYGVSHRGLIGTTSAAFLTPQQVIDIHAREDAVVQSGQPTHFIEHLTVNGRAHTWETIRFPFHDLEGRIAGSGFVGIDTENGASLTASQRELLRKAQVQTTPQASPLTPAATTPSGLAHLVWRASYESGNPAIDQQHRDLFSQCNQLLHAVVTPIPKLAVQSMLGTLRTMILQHFHDEESIMTQAGYPHVVEHHNEHIKLLAGIDGLIKDFDNDQMRLETIYRVLAHDVIYTHLLEMDRNYFAFLNPYFPIQP